MSANDLMDICECHPDFDGILETKDLPNDLVASAYEDLGSLGDDLSMAFPGARGMQSDERMLLVAPPDHERDGWLVRFAGPDPMDQLRAIQFEHPVDDDLLSAMKGVIGNDEKELKAFRQAVETAWQKQRQEIEYKNQAVNQGWQSIPMRHDDSVIAEALVSYQMI